MLRGVFPDAITAGQIKRGEVRAWLDKNPRIQAHFRPTSACWLNLDEVRFGIIERQAIHRGTYRSVRELTTAIRTIINTWETLEPHNQAAAPA